MMSEPFQSPDARHSPEEPSPFSVATLDTTAGSFLHRIAEWSRRRAAERVLSPVVVYIVAVAVTFLPLLIGALASPLSLVAATPPHRLPFLYDWNVLFMVCVSFPVLVVFIVNDQQVLCESLTGVARDRTLTISEADARPLWEAWRMHFRTANYCGQGLGLVAGVVVAYFNYRTYVPAKVGYWIAANDQLLPAGAVYLYCIFLFYCLVPVYVVRSVAVSLLLKALMARAQLRMLPLHPDKSGGLRPVGRLALRNQYLLTLFGLNIVIMVAVSFHYLEVPDALWGLIVAAIVAYLVVGPFVFVAPLLPFRAGMLRFKGELMAEVAGRLRQELQRIRATLQSGPVSKEDEELIDRLRKIASVIDDLPVWPFDADTLRKFFAAYIIPVLSSAAYPVAKAVFDFAREHMR